MIKGLTKMLYSMDNLFMPISLTDQKQIKGDLITVHKNLHRKRTLGTKRLCNLAKKVITRTSSRSQISMGKKKSKTINSEGE